MSPNHPVIKCNKQYTLDEILEECCSIYGVSPIMVKGKSRKEEYIKARRIFCYVAINVTNYSLKEISLKIGGKEHTRALHHINTVNGYLKCNDPEFMKDYDKYASQSAIWKDYLSK